MTLLNELKKLKNTEIAIVMSDGMSYRGKLTDYDHETVVMESVYEASAGVVDWVRTPKAAGGNSSTIVGYLTWRKITLPRLLARTDKILRIWPWNLPEQQ